LESQTTNYEMNLIQFLNGLSCMTNHTTVDMSLPKIQRKINNRDFNPLRKKLYLSDFTTLRTGDADLRF